LIDWSFRIQNITVLACVRSLHNIIAVNICYITFAYFISLLSVSTSNPTPHENNLLLLNTNGLKFVGESQLDSPDSPMAEDVPHRTDPSILDDDAAAEEEAVTGLAQAGGGATEDAFLEQTNKGISGPSSQRCIPREKQKTLSTASAASSSFSSCGNRPSLPPIYHTVRKLKKNKLVVRHLNGGGTSEMVCTNTGVTNSIAGCVGSFVNDNDKRHNILHTDTTTRTSET
jgi:hypothetical protein